MDLELVKIDQKVPEWDPEWYSEHALAWEDWFSTAPAGSLDLETWDWENGFEQF